MEDVGAAAAISAAMNIWPGSPAEIDTDKSDQQPHGKACEMASFQEAGDADGQKTKKLNNIAAKVMELAHPAGEGSLTYGFIETIMVSLKP
ncbi:MULTISPECIES: hypothetical protein [Agrobacterium tumefaciens complex]|uniref:hypothetical protein n=1 Tax=Agrobacterium tumefaciens complex TaxID=1183400 RepID=UPI0010BDE597|nr:MULTISPECIES: hypothetical protein [Agrobacterium tumefaciens complex]QCL87760.1 hypothetical protein CFBP6623_00495 [Agrobacterium tumefaciens]